MPRKPKRKKKETEIEKRAKDFAEEVEAIGKRFGKTMEKKGKEWECCRPTAFGFIGPLISSIFGIIVLLLGIWLLNWINIPTGSSFISRLTSFIFTNLHWFFAFFVYSNYTEYFSKKYSKSYWIISPLTTSIGIVIVIWISIMILNIINASVASSLILIASNFLYENLPGFFFLFLVLGYAFVTIKMLIMSPLGINMKKTKRLYRSGKEKVLGGVCGGIAEYLNVDPTIIRLLWVLFALTFGSGILAYIIAWIIIPRNPKHKW